eukprot:gene6325-8710_t
MEEVFIHRILNEDEILINVIITCIEPSLASQILSLFCTAIPLQTYNLEHLKRIRRPNHLNKFNAAISPIDSSSIETNNQQNDSLNELNENTNNKVHIIVCPNNQYDALPQEIKDICQVNYVSNVSRLEPLNRQEFEKWNKYWPINYHPSQAEKEREKGLNTKELQSMSSFLLKLEEEESLLKSFLLEKEFIKNNSKNDYDDIIVTLPHFSSYIHATGTMNCGIIVNPSNNRIVMTSLQAMKAHYEAYGIAAVNHPLYTPTMLCVDGVAAVVRGELDGQGSLPENHYLCTGLDLYLTEEPDLMSAMSLVHSRIRRVIFKNKNIIEGALATSHHIHCLPSLNHHYRVFTPKNSS